MCTPGISSKNVEEPPPPSQKGRECDAEEQQPSATIARPDWPEDRPGNNLSWLQRQYQSWTFSYMRPILRKGAHQTEDRRLTQDDLFAAPRTLQSRHLSAEFRKYWDGECQKGNRTSRSQTMQLMLTLWHLAAPTFVPAGFCQLLTVLCQVALPLLVRELLKVIEEHPNEQVIREGLPFALSIFGVAILNSFGNQRHRHLALRSGIVMRAAAINILYSHVLRLAPTGKAGLTTGEATNLIATDTQKLFEVAQEGHLIWALPLSIILVTICLVLVMGPTTLVGVAVLVLFVPVVQQITAKMLAIRNRRVEMTDERVGIVSAMLQGIKVTKLNRYEEKYEKRVTLAREKELFHLQKELAVWALTLVLIVISPIIATSATFAVYVLIDEDNVLTASRSFSVLLLFSALRFPINFAGRLLGKATQAYSAVKRITKFLEREVRPEETAIDERAVSGDEGPPLVMERAIFFTDAGERPAFQCNERVAVEKGEVFAVCGPVGGGKSSLINGIIDEMPASPETVLQINGPLAFVGQTAFILNDTLRANIVFGRAYDKNLYERVLYACCLQSDIDLLPSRDLTVIGERGVTLSGGQKQRVSLARAAYSCPDLVLLDDPLASLDSGTSKLVFDRLIKGPHAFFSNSAVVLVTHASYFLNRVDNVMVVVDGSSKFVGKWTDLASFEPKDDRTQSAIDFMRSSVQEDALQEGSVEKSDGVDGTARGDGKATVDALMTVEDREHGLSSLTTWLLWFKHAGGTYFLFFQILFMSIDRFMYVGVEWWIARWTTAADSSIEVFGIYFPPQTEGRSAQYKYLTVYSIIIAISVLATVIRSEWAVTGGRHAARNLFSNMLTRVLGAPLCSYFEATPLGRILNRFTYDMEVIDVTLTQTMSMFLISCSWYVAGVVVMVTIIPWIALGIAPVTVAYWFLLLYYRQTGNDLQRLDAVSRSPVQAMLSEALDGAAAIRVFSQMTNFTEKFFSVADQNSSALLCFVSAQRWLAFRIELLGSIIVLVASLLIISMNDTLGIDAGLAGLLILWSSNFTITLGFLVDTFSETEASITATERVDAMSRIQQEQSMITEEKNQPPDDWPTSGKLVFEGVCLRYRESLPLALNDLSFAIPAGKKAGLVGRTGAGKSSITAALFRLVEIESGRILLDGVDLGSLGLADVRGRSEGMSIIPQDPFLVGNTLRECIDPFSQASDAAILDALISVRLASSDSPAQILDTVVAEGGSNYSVGERQLLNLARALLSKPKVLVLDEATSSVDGETDALIQSMLRSKFSDTTLITVAHRLETIIDFDVIIVMDAGRAVEIGSPKKLLDQNGVFSELVDATGPEGSKALRAMVQSD